MHCRSSRPLGRSIAVATLLLAAACQSTGEAPTAPVADGGDLRTQLAGNSVFQHRDDGTIGNCAYLDPATYGYRFEDDSEIGRFLGWEVEDRQLCTYNGAVMDCFDVALAGDGTVLMTMAGSDVAMPYAVAAGDQCGVPEAS